MRRRWAEFPDGLLVPPRDSQALAEALGRLARSPTLRKRIGEAGYQTAVERFSIDAMLRQIQELYDEELARAGVAAVSGTSTITEPGRTGGDAPAQPRARAALEVPPL